MKTKKVASAVLALNGAVMLTAAPLLAVEVTGELGSPGGGGPRHIDDPSGSRMAQQAADQGENMSGSTKGINGS